MIRTMLGFLQGLATLAKPWWAWLALMMLANGVLPLFFLAAPEARVVLAAFALAAAIQMTIFRFKGFVRLLGVGHIVAWVPLVGWLWSRLPLASPGSGLRRWILAVIVVDSLSLVIDFVDLARYVAGERQPTFKPDDTA